MTALDIWFIICMLHVAMAMFEYAILLTIKFGKQNKISVEMDVTQEEKAVKKCRKIDLYALRVFAASYILTVGTYFYKYIEP